MEQEQMESYVRCLLESWAVQADGREQVVWQTLHDLLMAVVRYELMSPSEKELTTQISKRLQSYFETKFNLKERKRKTKKENFPPYPLLKEKQIKEKEQKNIYIVCDADSGFDEDLLKRLKAFEAECEQYVGQYGRAMVDDFIRYWTMPNQTTGRMKFEEQRYWRLSSKLKSWQKTSYTIDNSVAAMRGAKEQKKHEKAAAAALSQQQQAAERERADAAREEQSRQARAGQMLTEEYVRQHPDGIMARIYRRRKT